MRNVYLCAIAACTMLAGCATTGAKDANYTAYLDLIHQQQQDIKDQRAAFAQMAAKCQGDACIAQVAAIAALAGAGAEHVRPQQYVPHESTAARFGLALVSQISPLAAAAVSWHASDTSRDVALGQYAFLGGALHDFTGSINTLGETAAGLAPSITIGGDYTGRDKVGGDLVGGDKTGGDKIGGDRIGRDRIDNAGRYYSPGPYDDHSATGDGCAGSTTCQTTAPPADPTTPDGP